MLGNAGSLGAMGKGGAYTAMTPPVSTFQAGGTQPGWTVLFSSATGAWSEGKETGKNNRDDVIVELLLLAISNINGPSVLS